MLKPLYEKVVQYFRKVGKKSLVDDQRFYLWDDYIEHDAAKRYRHALKRYGLKLFFHS